jgi:hypothetical protein
MVRTQKQKLEIRDWIPPGYRRPVDLEEGALREVLCPFWSSVVRPIFGVALRT